MSRYGKYFGNYKDTLLQKIFLKHSSPVDTVNTPYDLGDNSRDCMGSVLKHPRAQGGFDVILPEPDVAYSCYTTELANFRYFHSNSYHLALQFVPPRSCWSGVLAILFMGIYWILSHNPYLNKCNTLDVMELGIQSDVLVLFYMFFIHVPHVVCVRYQRVAASGAINDVGFGMSISGKSEGLTTWDL